MTNKKLSLAPKFIPSYVGAYSLTLIRARRALFYSLDMGDIILYTPPGEYYVYSSQI